MLGSLGLKRCSQCRIAMSIQISIPTMRPGPFLTVDRVRTVLGACGYRSTAALLAGTQLLSPGCTLSLQFGDQVALGAAGATRLTIRCSLQINGFDERVDGVTYWQIRRSLEPCAGFDGFSIAIEADLILGSGERLADILVKSGEAYRHLRMLIADARATLQDLCIDDSSGRQPDAPVVRIEAKFLGDLAMGHSGLVVSAEPPVPHRASTTTLDLRMTLAACDCLHNDILPDLARAVRSMILQVSPSKLCKAEACVDMAVAVLPDTQRQLR
jgi:hypothetical protein